MENLDIQVKEFLTSETYANIKQIYNAGIKEIMTKLEILDEEYHLKYDYNPIHTIDHRLKSPKSIIKKLNNKNLVINDKNIRDFIHDIAGVRVTCNYIDDLYTIVDVLTMQDDITQIELKDYIKNPKESGYRSLHLVVLIPVFLSKGKTVIPVEIQIRTIAMDFWASLEHHLKYKTKNSIPHNIHEELKQCANEITAIDNKMQKIHNQIKNKAP